MKIEIDANINALEIHDSVLDNSVNIINSSIVNIDSSISDVSTRLATANTNIGVINSSIVNINSSIGKIANDLAQHMLDCDATHTEFSQTWAAALVDIRKEIDDLKNQVSQLQTNNETNNTDETVDTVE